MKRWKAYVPVIALLVLLLGGCGSGQTVPAQGDETQQYSGLESADPSQEESSGNPSGGQDAQDDPNLPAGQGSAEEEDPPQEDGDGDTASSGTEETDPVEEVEKEDLMTAWVAYWDTENLEERLAQVRGKLDRLVIFAAYYRDRDAIFIPEASTQSLELARQVLAEEEVEYYLSVVNDLVDASGSHLKDTDLLYRLLSSTDQAQSHARQIVDLALAGGYDGVEIDFEKLRQDRQLWSYFLVFEEYLWELCRQEGLKLRVLLEPFPLPDGVTLPQGPEYVVMCYNLHYEGTDPGPKADEDFLSSIVGYLAQVPDLGFALANGGYSWLEGSTQADSLSQSQIRAILDSTGAVPVRDQATQALEVRYTDETGNRILWYADETTLDHWRQLIGEKTGRQIRLEVWRL